MRSSQLGAILMAVTLLVYLNSFPGAFHYDDFPLLLDNPRVSGPDFAYSSYLDHYAGRPLTLWTLHWNYRFFGDNPLSYHLVSVLLHAFVVLQIFLLVFQLYNQRLLAFSTALLFAVHPLQTQAVNYIWSRSVLLMATFGFAALLSARKRPWVALFCFQLAIWSRTEGLILLVPLLILSRPRWRKLSVLAMVNLVGFVYSMSAYAPVKVAWNYPHPFAYWSLAPTAFWKYLSMMMWPAGLNLDHHMVSAGPGWNLIGFLALLGLLAAAFRLRKAYPIPSLGIFWLALMLAPSLLMPNTDILNESRAYMSFAGFALVAGWLFSNRLPNLHIGFKVSAALLILVLLVPMTLARNRVWNDDLALWQDSVLKSPDKSRPHYNLGVALARLGRNIKAEVEFQNALNLNPEDDLSYAGLGYCAEVHSQLTKASTLYRQALALNPNNIYAQESLERVEDKIEKGKGL